MCSHRHGEKGNYSKKWTYDGKNVAGVAYVVDNSQICIEQCRILDMNMMWIINLYFYIGCKWR